MRTLADTSQYRDRDRDQAQPVTVGERGNFVACKLRQLHRRVEALEAQVLALTSAAKAELPRKAYDNGQRA